MIKEKARISNLKNVSMKRMQNSNSNYFSLEKKENKSNALNISKANQYKIECIEALQNGKVYKTTKEMLADVSNW